MENNTGIHPAPLEFTRDELGANPILQFFHYTHLPTVLRAISMPFCELAGFIIRSLPRNAERTVALRKLLEAKDAAVRANLPMPGQAPSRALEPVATIGEPRETGVMMKTATDPEIFILTTSFPFGNSKARGCNRDRRAKVNVFTGGD